MVTTMTRTGQPALDEAWKYIDLTEFKTLSWKELVGSGFSLSTQGQFDGFSCELDHQNPQKAVITVKEGAQIPQTLELTWDTPSSTVGRPHLVVQMEKNSRLNLVLNYRQEGQGAGYCEGKIEIQVADGAQLDYVSTTLYPEQSYHFETITVESFTASQFRGYWLTASGRQTRREMNVNLNGENSHTKLYGLGVLSDKTELYTHTTFNHLVPNCESHQYFKNILSGTSQCEFNGLVHVIDIAQKTDSYQSNHNLLLTDTCRAISRPQLKIFADDVKCSHGATIGQLDDEQLFYLKSRGLDFETARSVLLFGFAEEIIETIPIAKTRMELEDKIKGLLEAL